mmetsp:Transcript_6676/g.24975  ORF Transcript_6676/g.24975 Transcript_6676/m.24975 type:complete len:309 (+) Transcript_6676:481-1407(+)
MGNQPSRPLRKLRPLKRTSPSLVSVLGPSSTSKISPASKVRCTLLPEAKAASRGTLRRQLWCDMLSAMYTVPWLPFMVAQPSLPSLEHLMWTRVIFLSSSTLGASICSIISPTSIFRIALQLAMSKAVVRAIVPLQIISLVSSKAGSVCVLSLSVTHPIFPSFRAFPLTRTTSKAASFRGPSKTSITSPASTARASSLPDSFSFCTAAASFKIMYGFSAFSMKSVPWLPLTVTQPSARSCNARHRTRSKPTVSSLDTPPKTSKSSPFSSLRMVPLVFTSKAVVRAMSFTHLLYSCSMAKSPNLVTPAL